MQKEKMRTKLQLCAAGILLLWVLLVALGQQYGLGQKYLVVKVNGSVIGMTSADTDVDSVMHDSRRILAKQTEGYLMQEIVWETEESRKLFVPLMDETELRDAVLDALQDEDAGAQVFAYTVNAGGTFISFPDLAEVEDFLNRIKAEADAEDSFGVCFYKKDDHREGSLQANLMLRKQVSEEPATAGDAGVILALDRALKAAEENPGENRYQRGILEMEFTEDVEIFTDVVPRANMMSIEDAVAEVTKTKETNKIYEIEPGDCLSVIAVKHDTTVDSIVTLNGFEDENVIIMAGQEIILAVPEPDIALRICEGVVYEEDYTENPIIIPNDAWYTTDEVVRQEGTVGRREVNAVVVTENGIETERSMIHQTILAESVPAVIEQGTKIPPTYIKPISGGRFTSGFGMRWGRMHNGVDWACPTGTTVYASSSGTVVSAGWASGYGNCVLISHPDGRMTRYAHNSALLVTAGQSVSQGQSIALSGSTGRSTGPHVHFEIYINGSRVNPLKYLN
ncbi:MAG: peptidoglycan DD-metalloendopeptidase family protein [Lachnospiraceae bacterium]|nr:peptidoglycan DD-metalloendopeptidase family protein [Lachnospiraceae bacterium]